MTVKSKAVIVAATFSLGPAAVGWICELIWREPSAFSIGMLATTAALGVAIMLEPAKLIDWIDQDLHRYPAAIPFEEYKRNVWLWPVGVPRHCALKVTAGQTCLERNAVILCGACTAMTECREDYERDLVDAK